MKTKSLFLVLALIVMIALVAVGCGQQQTASPTPPAPPAAQPAAQPAPATQTAAQPTNKATYVGTAVCASCHDDANPDKFPHTKHAAAFKPFSAFPLDKPAGTQVLFDATNKDKAVSYTLDFSKNTLGVMMDHYVVAEIPKSAGFGKLFYRVGTVEKQGEKYVLKAAKEVDYDKDGKADWSAEDYTCASCHSPGITVGSKDLGISCESCHGPGSEHVTSQNKKSTIKSGAAAAEACLTCHTSNPVKDANGNYTTQNHYGTRDYFASTHASSKYQISCLTCHSPHKTNADGAMLRENNPNDVCMKCHADKKYDVATMMWINKTDVHSHLTADHSFGAMKYEDLGDDPKTPAVEIKNPKFIDLLKQKLEGKK